MTEIRSKSPADAFAELVRIMARLRAPGGCPWDREQTHETIKPYLIEEAYEVIEAIDSGDAEELKKELGDLLLQVVFHAQMAEEAGRFDVAQVVEAICAKLVHRHPHVFADTKVADAAEVLQNWSRIKAGERAGSDDRSAIAGVPRGMPALLRAARLGEKAGHVGFDWTRAEEVLLKVREEVDELDEALRAGRKQEIEAELGDVLFALTSFARHADVEPEAALAKAADRFSQRFRRMEAGFHAEGRDLHDVPAAEMEAAWQRVKREL
jgi:tetrapyrrole methylase family protein / MazG family protein